MRVLSGDIFSRFFESVPTKQDNRFHRLIFEFRFRDVQNVFDFNGQLFSAFEPLNICIDASEHHAFLSDLVDGKERIGLGRDDTESLVSIVLRMK